MLFRSWRVRELARNGKLSERLTGRRRRSGCRSTLKFKCRFSLVVRRRLTNGDTHEPVDWFEVACQEWVVTSSPGRDSIASPGPVQGSRVGPWYR